MWRKLFEIEAISVDLASLLARLVFGALMILNHGWPKLADFPERMNTFPDPLGIGSPLSLTGAVFAEVGCALLIMAGVGTRLAAIPLAFTMFVASMIVNWSEPFNKKEMALLYLAACIVIFLLGSGKYSLDAWWKTRRSGNKTI